MSPYVRTVKTGSGATAVQIVHSSHRGSRDIEHIGSAHCEAELEMLKAAARQRLAAGQDELDLGLDAAAAGAALPITSSRMGCLLDALSRAYEVLGFEAAAGGDEVFRHLVLARIIEPASKLDSLRVLQEAGAGGPSYATLKRRLPAYARQEWRERLSAACAAHARLGIAALWDEARADDHREMELVPAVVVLEHVDVGDRDDDLLAGHDVRHGLGEDVRPFLFGQRRLLLLQHITEIRLHPVNACISGELAARCFHSAAVGDNVIVLYNPTRPRQSVIWHYADYEFVAATPSGSVEQTLPSRNPVPWHYVQVVVTAVLLFLGIAWLLGWW